MRAVTLWIAAVVVTLAAAAWQRRSGPSYPYRTSVTVGGAALRLSLPRTGPTTSAARVVVPTPSGDPAGTLHWRRYPTSDSFAAVPLRPEAGALSAELPAQPPAGKVEYYLELTDDAGRERVPSAPGRTVVLRFHGPVPALVLIPHIGVMFLAMLLGVRAGLAAAFERDRHRSITLITLAALTVGGLVLGPVTQKYAFGALWTGVPFGSDLTDNKALVAWIGWALAAAAVWRRRPHAPWLVVAAAVVMLAAYAVPHSLLGSQLDYSRLPAGGGPR